MKTPDEIKKGLECCNTGKSPACEICSYKSFELGPHGVHYVNYHCKQLQIDALAYINQLERERDALLEIVRNEADCKVCKHLKEECDGDCSFCEIEEPCACARCTTEDSHWEYAGIKEDNP